jgi:hypothetical protein
MQRHWWPPCAQDRTGLALRCRIAPADPGLAMGSPMPTPSLSTRACEAGMLCMPAVKHSVMGRITRGDRSSLGLPRRAAAAGPAVAVRLMRTAGVLCVRSCWCRRITRYFSVSIKFSISQGARRLCCTGVARSRGRWDARSGAGPVGRATVEDRSRGRTCGSALLGHRAPGGTAQLTRTGRSFASRRSTPAPTGEVRPC